MVPPLQSLGFFCLSVSFLSVCLSRGPVATWQLSSARHTPHINLNFIWLQSERGAQKEEAEGGRGRGRDRGEQQLEANCCQVASLGATFLLARPGQPGGQFSHRRFFFFSFFSPASTFRLFCSLHAFPLALALSLSPSLSLCLYLPLSICLAAFAAEFFRFLDYFLKRCCYCRLSWKLLKRDSRHITLHDFSMWHLGANPLTDTLQ